MNSYLRSGIDTESTIAYFSMEIGIASDIPTYSGGLGVLAGDTLKSCADLGLPVVGITLLYRKGYFRQEITGQGEQKEHPVDWRPEDHLQRLPGKIVLDEIEGRSIITQAWLYIYTGTTGKPVPILFLDTDLEENEEPDRRLTDSLYAGDSEFRLKQEILLGIGGVKYLRELGFNRIHTYHMNEGHSSLLTLELLREHQRTVFETWDEETVWDVEKVKSLCVFTTHTPVSAGHDRFGFDLVERVLKTGISMNVIRRLSGEDCLNMTTLGLNLSRFANGVAYQHGDVSSGMFPHHQIDFITNGIHTYTWVHESFRKLFDRHARLWKNDPKYLREAMSIPRDEVWQAHLECKNELFDRVSKMMSETFDPNILTLGFARRAAAYKRASLMFRHLDRLIEIAESSPGLQIVYAGKSHPKDEAGKRLIREIHEFQKKIEQRTKKLKLVYIPNYNMDLGYYITGGVDVWVNTPIRPHEASGTSGMKAALNGVLNLSILDGWWVEGCIEGVTGWAIGDLDPRLDLSPDDRDDLDCKNLHDTLESKVIPKYYEDRTGWADMQCQAIAINGSLFNTHRQMEQYVTKAYFSCR
ncbi:Alpha-glucan phosphorylase [Nitrospina gracilis 3/211]|uniref:glycogen phosphorylase n=1 Tax=Nitrospina gracilis (strain 3/211) TaxID=1266370 RepID=M1YZP0_NITG3|nr:MULTISPECIES: alpha-glucan family phosphorylase [Nitrospina]MCF8723635.1 starch phosphorylase [Nitrospina sp. Nb-3]CCQ90721.1 Alpha-glucan phosphorylase [Nitrospina gracilis 3/211]